jgi:hypothetical protein
MRFLIKLKPYQHVLGFFIILFVGFFISIPLDKIISQRFEYLNFIVPSTFFTLPIAFWIYYIGYSLDLIDKKTGNKRGLNHFILSVGLIFVCTLTTLITTNYFLIIQKTSVPIWINLLISIFEIYGLIYIIQFITKRFATYYNKRNVRIIDYLGYVILISIIPLGIGIFQSQIKTILNDENIDIK